MPRSRLDLDCRGSRAKTAGHLYCWINLPDVGVTTVADFGRIGDFGKIGVIDCSLNSKKWARYQTKICAPLPASSCMKFNRRGVEDVGLKT